MELKDYFHVFKYSFSCFWDKLNADDLPRNDEAREALYEINDPRLSYWYARKCDGSHVYTRMSACGDPKYAYHYAKEVDKVPRDDTKKACKVNAYWMERYTLWENSIKKK